MKLKEIGNHPNFKDIKIIKFEKFSDKNPFFSSNPKPILTNNLLFLIAFKN